VCVRVRVCVCM